MLVWPKKNEWSIFDNVENVVNSKEKQTVRQIEYVFLDALIKCNSTATWQLRLS